MEPTSGVGKPRPGAVELPGGYSVVPDVRLSAAAEPGGQAHLIPMAIRLETGKYILVPVEGAAPILGHLTPTVDIDPTPTILPDQPPKGAA